jgi:ABC-type multidrug transport system fused ATPase/permease subunit
MWHTFWDFLWSAIVVFAFIAYLLILFNIVVDLFWRDHQTSGWVKAAWVIFLIVFPYLTALVYLIARGEGMAIRAREAAMSRRDGHAGTIAARTPVQEIAHAKELLDGGAITQAEFETLKAKVLRD